VEREGRNLPAVGDEDISLWLQAGDAYEMDREMQKYYQHSVSKDTKQADQVKMRGIDLVFRYGAEHTDDILNEVEMELIWLGEESMYCLVCPEFQFDFIYEHASPALKVELRKLSRDDQSETGKLKQIVRMEDRLVSRHFDFTRKDIRMNYF
jgi:hypothetical protein